MMLPFLDPQLRAQKKSYVFAFLNRFLDCLLFNFCHLNLISARILLNAHPDARGD